VEPLSLENARLLVDSVVSEMPWSVAVFDRGMHYVAP